VGVLAIGRSVDLDLDAGEEGLVDLASGIVGSGSVVLARLVR